MDRPEMSPKFIAKAIIYFFLSLGAGLLASRGCM